MGHWSCASAPHWAHDDISGLTNVLGYRENYEIKVYNYKTILISKLLKRRKDCVLLNTQSVLLYDLDC